MRPRRIAKLAEKLIDEMDNIPCSIWRDLGCKTTLDGFDNMKTMLHDFALRLVRTVQSKSLREE